MTKQEHQNIAAQTYGISREHARHYPCPKCHAAVGEPCVRVNGRTRTSNHIERVCAAASEVSTNERIADEATPASLAFIEGYLLGWSRIPAVARLTPREQEVGARALHALVSGRQLLEARHKNGDSLEEIAARWNLPLHAVARGYAEIVSELATRATPLLETCCASCLRQMPDVIFDSTLRCPGCLASLPQSDKPSPNALDIEELKANCVVLGARWTAPTFEIEAVFEKHLRLWNHIIESVARSGKRHPHAEDARAKANEAWKFIKTHRAKYGN